MPQQVCPFCAQPLETTGHDCRGTTALYSPVRLEYVGEPPCFKVEPQWITEYGPEADDES